MPIYKKPSAELVYDLINESNPGLSQPVSSSNTKVGTPTTIAVVPPSIANSSILLSASANSFYIGNKTLQYRRLSFADLFKGKSLEIRKYSPAGAGTSPFSLYQLLADINNTFGLTLTTDDIADANFPAASDGFYPDRTSKVTMTAKAGSLAWVGSIDVRWVFAKNLLTNIVTVTDVNGRAYPGGNVFDSNHKYVVNSDMGVDLSQFSAVLNGVAFNAASGIGGGQITAQQPIFDFLNQQLGTQYTIDSAHAGQAWNIYNASNARFTLPDATLPEADSTYFNRVIVVTLPDANVWGVGKLYLFYNV